MRKRGYVGSSQVSSRHSRSRKSRGNKPGVDGLKQGLRIYPLAQATNPPAMNFVNASGKAFNTIHAMDFSYFEEVNEVVQEELPSAIDPETLGLLASIGIEKGKPFAPDQRMKAILIEAASVGNATARTLTYRTRLEGARLYPDDAGKDVCPSLARSSMDGYKPVSEAGLHLCRRWQASCR